MESLFLTSFSEKKEETIPVIISPLKTISASLGKAREDHSIHLWGCRGLEPSCLLTISAPWVQCAWVETLELHYVRPE